MNRKKLIFSAIFTFITAGSIFVYQQQKENTKHTFITHLNSLEQQTWQAFENLDISKDELFEKIKKYDQMHKKSTQNNTQKKEHRPIASSKIRNLITLVADFLHFDLSNMDLISTKDPNQSPAVASINAIYVDEDAVLQFTDDAIKFIIAHEIQHILNQDSYGLYAVDQALKERQIELQKDDPEFVSNQFSRFNETRADINAATAHPEIAHGYIEFTQEVIKQGRRQKKTHPKHEDRLALAQEIYSSMTQTA